MKKYIFSALIVIITLFIGVNYAQATIYENSIFSVSGSGTGEGSFSPCDHRNLGQLQTSIATSTQFFVGLSYQSGSFGTGNFGITWFSDSAYTVGIGSEQFSGGNPKAGVLSYPSSTTNFNYAVWLKRYIPAGSYIRLNGWDGSGNCASWDTNTEGAISHVFTNNQLDYTDTPIVTGGGVTPAINILEPVFSATIATTTARFNSFIFNYTLDHSAYPYHTIYSLLGTDPTHLNLTVGTFSTTSLSNSGDGAVQSVNNYYTDWVDGVTYYMRLVMWGTQSLLGEGELIPDNQVAISNQVVFTIASGTLIQVTPPTHAGGNIFEEKDCSQFPLTETYLGIPFLAPTFFSGTICVFESKINDLYIRTGKFGNDKLDEIYGKGKEVFPLSIFYTVKADIEEVQANATTTQADIEITGGAGSAFNGRHIVLFSSSSAGWIEEHWNIDYRGFIDYVLWALFGAEVIAIAALIIVKTHDTRPS